MDRNPIRYALVSLSSVYGSNTSSIKRLHFEWFPRQRQWLKFSKDLLKKNLVSSTFRMKKETKEQNNCLLRFLKRVKWTKRIKGLKGIEEVRGVKKERELGEVDNILGQLLQNGTVLFLHGLFIRCVLSNLELKNFLFWTTKLLRKTRHLYCNNMSTDFETLHIFL